jgi:hypothetical protein
VKSALDVEHAGCFIANVAGTGYAIGDKLIRVYYHDVIANSTTFAWINDTTETVMPTAPIMANLRSCEEKLDVEITEQVHTDLTTGEITDLIQHVVYDGQGVEVSRFYTDINTSAIFTPTGVVDDEPVRVVVGSEVITADDITPVVLTVPPFTAGAHFQVHDGNGIKFSVSGTAPVSGLTGVGTYAQEYQTGILHSAIEVNNFQFIAVDATALSEIYVEYFNTSIETGI